MQEFFESTTGITVTIATAAVLLVIGIGAASKNRKMNVRTLVLSAMLVTLATVFSNFKLLHMPQGGSITLFSMLPVTLVGFLFGPVKGIVSAVAYGLIQMALGPYVIHPAQLVCDYLLAFGALGISGFLRSKKWGLVTGYLLAVAGRLFFTTLSGVVFFSETLGWDAIWYSLTYNAAYIGGEALLTAALLIAVVPLRRLLEATQRKYGE